jgi:hypothetical protein
MTFQITALDPHRFEKLFDMPGDALADERAIRRIAIAKPGFPCRVSLVDAEVGDELILVNFEHQSGDSPYRASHAIFVRKGAEQAHPAIGEVPQALSMRELSLRAFDDGAIIVAADLVAGRDLGPALDRLFAEPLVAYVHVHYAAYGCYAARADRA